MSQNTALLVVSTMEQAVATVPAALKVASQNQLRLRIVLAHPSPIDIQNTLALLGLLKEDVLISQGTYSVHDPSSLTQWLGDLISRQKPALLMVPAGTAFGDVCDKISERHQLPLAIVERDLPATRALIHANSELTTFLERQTPYIPPTHKIVVIWARSGQYTQDQFHKTGAVLLKLVEELDVSILYPVRMDSAIQQGLYQNIRWHEHIHLLEPLEHLAFIHLLSRADLVISRSSAVANEAKEMGCPLVTGDSVENTLENLEQRVKAIIAGGG
ncbi:MAG: UDP-N-acetylglucosamine 2-epimerase [Halioglobus sp.]